MIFDQKLNRRGAATIVFLISGALFFGFTVLMFDFKRKLGSDDITEKIFPADVSALNDVLAFIERQLEKANYPIKTVTRICVAIEEVFVNVAHYAYKDGKIAFGFDKSSHTATFVPG